MARTLRVMHKSLYPLLALLSGLAFSSLSAAAQVPPAYRVTSNSATFRLQHTIDYATEGQSPQMLVAGPDHVQYGLSLAGGLYGNGALIQISPSGSYSVSHSFTTSEGLPTSTLVVGDDGSVVAGTQEVVTNGVQIADGEILNISAAGAYTVLHRFAPVTNPENPDWWIPYVNEDGAGYTRVVQAADGTIYGTKSAGGAAGSGTIFKISTDGIFSILHSFSAVDPTNYVNGDGATPSFAEGSLLLAVDGTLYGLTTYGGAYGAGVVFKIAADGTYSVLYQVAGTSAGGLLMGNDGNLYGWTRYALGNTGVVSNGYVFKLTPAGQFTTLYTPPSSRAAPHTSSSWFERLMGICMECFIPTPVQYSS